VSVVPPGDPGYVATVNKRFNKRFAANPEYVCLIHSTDEAIDAVQRAVEERRRVVATSGGHCLEGLVSDPTVQVIVDVAHMKRVHYDAERNAIAGIGIGGHVVGGAFGFLCRQLGLAADYLSGVEVVTVGSDGRARSVIATRDQSEPNHDLWWAHTGGGGGNFGIVMRYWFRRPGASDTDPRHLLPRAPESITTFRAEWDWSRIDEDVFVHLLENYGTWCERHSHADSPNASLFSLMEIHRKQFGKIIIRGVSTAGRGARQQIDGHLAAIVGSSDVRSQALDVVEMSWLEFALNPFPDLFAFPPGGIRLKAKDALLKKRLTERQARVAYTHLTSVDVDVMGGMLGVATYGGRINTVAPDATASCHRASIVDLACSTGWLDASEDERNLKWVRGFYRDLFANTGGVPVPGEAYDGSMINHPDTDLTDPVLNTSGVPWHQLYYQSNYPRLQRVKGRWDPLNVFRHPLSITPAAL
jgi:hypothetical protein